VHNTQSRALYAADIMLAWQVDSEGCSVMQPKLLEVNWAPDCQRACEYYPDFYDDVFGLLFLDEEKDVFKLL
jgi:tubulin--tyrosine ligase-like protein 12